MSLLERKAGAAAVDPDDHNAVVDAVVALQAGGGGGSQAVLVATATLDAAGIAALTTPVVLVPAVAGKAIVPILFSAAMGTGSTAWTNPNIGGEVPQLFWGDEHGATENALSHFNGALKSAAESFSVDGGFLANTISGLLGYEETNANVGGVNLVLAFSSGLLDYTGGDFGAKVQLLYTLVDLA